MEIRQVDAGGIWLITTGAPRNRGSTADFSKKGRSRVSAVIAYVCTIQVESVDDCVGKGGGARREQTSSPKEPCRASAGLANSKDTEGNIFGMMQNDPEAK